jgi:hypothetical protein
VYPKVDHSHVVPAGYLRRWAVDGRLVMHPVGGGEAKAIGVRDAGVRKAYYRRERPETGEKIDDVEWTLRQVEDKGLPVLADLGSRWPLESDDKVNLAALLGIQAVRGERWMNWHGDFTRGWADERLATGGVETEDEADRVHEHLTSDTPRLVRMIVTGAKVGSVIGSMHWSLVSFRTPLLGTSDDPVVFWPAGEGRRRPGPPPFETGMLITTEAFVPVAPDLAILGTWLDRPDDHAPRPGKRHHAKAINAFVIAQADTQWFHRPGTEPPVGVGLLPPLSIDFHPRYSVADVASSHRRAETANGLQARRGLPDMVDNMVEIVYLQ